MSDITVIKISGHGLTDEGYLKQFVQAVKKRHGKTIIVHGGGVEITELQTRLDIEPQYIDGLRITDAASMSLVTMVLCGLVNKRMVRHFNAGGMDAIGICGIDRGIITARKMPHATVDMGYTGEIVSVHAEALQELLDLNLVPIISPVCGDDDTEYNVNADPVTGAIAQAMNAEKVIFLSNVEGVLINETMQPTLTAPDVHALIDDATIYGGMIPKVTTALDLLNAGIPEVVITNLAGLRTHGGTTFIQST